MIHEECFPTYWNIDAFNDFFAIDGTFALIMSSCGPGSGSTGSPAVQQGSAQSFCDSQDDIGMIVYRFHGEDADIMTMAVKPAFRRRGVACELLAKTLVHMASLGAQKMFLDVEEGNTPALSLYEKHGFTQVRRRKNYYRKKDGTCTDALVMSRKLR